LRCGGSVRPGERIDAAYALKRAIIAAFRRWASAIL
jgi:hypothetical protein